MKKMTIKPTDIMITHNGVLSADLWELRSVSKKHHLKLCNSFKDDGIFTFYNMGMIDGNDPYCICDGDPSVRYLQSILNGVKRYEDDVDLIVDVRSMWVSDMLSKDIDDHVVLNTYAFCIKRMLGYFSLNNVSVFGYDSSKDILPVIITDKFNVELN